MKYLVHRITALLLAGLLLLSAGGILTFAAQPGQSDPYCRLGTRPLFMLAGGGRSVETAQGTYYLDDEDDSVRLFSTGALVVSGPVAKLNYENGVLYYARLHTEDGGFDLCAYDLNAARETVLLSNFFGKLGQVYLVDGTYLDFSCDNAVWQLELETGSYRLIQFAQDLWSFVPTGCGLIYATGSLFDYTIYADGRELVAHADDYNVDFSLGDGALIYSLDGNDYQLDLSGAFAGLSQPVQFTGYGYTALSGDTEAPALTPEEQAEAEEAERQRIEQELAEILSRPENQPPVLAPPVDNSATEAPPDPAQADPNDPQAPAKTEPAAPTEPAATEPAATEPAATEPAPTQPAATEPAPAATEPAPAAPQPAAPQPASGNATDEPAEPYYDAPVCVIQPREPVAVIPEDGALRRNATVGVQNIVRRARQMLNIRWTPRKNVSSWGYGITYQQGVTYTGLPYCQGCNYVPWNTSLDAFVNAVNDPNSKMYTARTTYGKTGPYFGTDCSGFVSWTWDTGTRCNSLSSDRTKSYYVGRSYEQIELGDALVSDWHIMVVTDVTYDENGSINAIEISHANNDHSFNDCCYSMHYVGTSGLLQLKRTWLDSGYSIYRGVNRNQVTYTHSCAVPLVGDECSKCGMGKFYKPGVDVSEHQGVIDWQKASAEISFAILRVGYTGTENPVQQKDACFEANAKGCEDNNVPYGVYFYAGATTPEQARQEAQCVLNYLGYDRILSGRVALPVFYDVEEEKNILRLSDEQLLAVISAFCSTLEDAGLRPGIYASTNIWNNRLPASAIRKNWIRWVAQWDYPVCTAIGGANIWQYAVRGRVSGIATAVDLNYWMGNVGDLEHSYQTTEISATCTQGGQISYSCLYCNKHFEEQIPALGHSFVQGVCTRCGKVQTIYDRFTDIAPGRWYSAAVETVVEQGLFGGMSETVFGKETEMNRGMLISVLYALAGKPAVADETLFEDVKPTSYFAPAVVWGSHYGVIGGISPTKFSPKKAATREQVAVILYHYLLNLDPSNADAADLSGYPDYAALSAYAQKGMAWAVSANIISGITTDGTTYLRPRASATRAQVAVILTKFVAYLEEKGLEDAASEVFQPVLP